MTRKRQIPLKIYFLTLFLLLFSACSQTDLALRYADQFIAWELKDQFGFRGEQKQKIDELSKKTLNQLKKDFLPDIIEELKAIKLEFSNRDWAVQSVEDGARFVNEKRLKLKKLGLKSLQLLSQNVPEFAELTEEKNWQIFVKNFRDKNTEIAESKTKSRFPQLLDRFLGDLTSEQEKILKSNAEALKVDPLLRVKNREKILEQLNLRLAPFSKEAFSRTLTDFFTNSEKWNDSTVSMAQEQRVEKQMQLLAEILKMMTPKQKKNVLAEWEDIIQDLKKGAQ